MLGFLILRACIVRNIEIKKHRNNNLNVLQRDEDHSQIRTQRKNTKMYVIQHVYTNEEDNKISYI